MKFKSKLSKLISVIIALNCLSHQVGAKDIIASNINSPNMSSLMNTVKLMQSKINSPSLKKKVVQASTSVLINKPVEDVWNTLVNFKDYPEIFNKIESCHILKQNKELVYIESFLKKQMFVNETCQHTINDLSQGPKKLTWYLLDGNFEYVEGSWNLIPKNNGKSCLAVYKITTIPGSVIPKTLVNVALNFVEKDVTSSLKSACERLD